MGRLGRREFVIGAGASSLALLAGCGRLPFQGPPQAQSPVGVARIGFLTAISRQGTTASIEALLQGLADYGYVEGRNLTIEWRFAEGKLDRLPALTTAQEPPIQLIFTRASASEYDYATSEVPTAAGLAPVAPS